MSRFSNPPKPPTRREICVYSIEDNEENDRNFNILFVFIPSKNEHGKTIYGYREQAFIFDTIRL